MSRVGLPGIPVDSLPSWGFQGQADEAASSGLGPGAATAFLIDENLNSKVSLWQGKLWKLDVDAVGNTSNETLTATSGVSKELLERGGNEVIELMQAAAPCRTGEAVVTKGGYLPARFVVHSVGPRFNERYRTAAENALHLSYLNSLTLCKEKGLRTVALPPLYTLRKAYPRDEAAHIALRTVRCFLDRFAPDFDRVLLVVDTSEDEAIYADLMPLYFPRTYDDEHRAASTLPTDRQWDANGAAVIEERGLRIGVGASTADDAAGDPSTPASVAAGSTATALLRDDGSFVHMRGDPDEERVNQIKQHRESLTRSQAEEEEAQRRYASYLRRAKEQSLADIEQLGFIRRTGTDGSGRPIIVVLASALPTEPTEELMERLLLYMVLQMDLHASRPFVLVYSHALLCDSPDFSWLSEVFGIFRRQFQRHLHRVYVLHPTIWLKLLLFFLLPLMEDGFNDSIVYCETTRELLGVFDIQQVRLPAAVVQYDVEVTAADEAQHMDEAASQAL